jgi:hypothetical protein
MKKKNTSKSPFQGLLDRVENWLKEIPPLLEKRPVPQPIPVGSPATSRRKKR